tara:strand:+ start:84 stop:2264 length:2181 start_codon:yes stop_codon:yes gene_type:complete
VKIIKYTLFIFFLINTQTSKAECNFKTGEFIDKLNNSNSIRSLRIDIPNSRRYASNQVKILTSANQNILPIFRKKHAAEVFINYKFGSCKYKGKVWQNGDGKDHIKYKGGNIISSLNVKLINGNLHNSVKFKLLIPETRNHLNEILGSIILKKHNFIVPETFEIETSINGVSSLMIFQEDSQKELLERNNRREGPIFEGDESLLWSSNVGEGLLFDAPNLARLINYKSSLKGENTFNIYLNSYLRLQDYYLRSSYFVNPSLSSNIYKDYLFLMLSMNGQHGLIKTNQKHYFNLLSKNFEPIYYDGDFNLNSDLKLKPKKLISKFSNKYSYPYLNKLKDKSFLNEIENIFESKVKIYDSSKRQFFINSISKIKANQKLLQSVIYSNKKFQEDLNINKNSSESISSFIEKNRYFKPNLFFITSYKINGSKVSFLDHFGKESKVSLIDFSKILSRKRYKDKSFILLPIKNLISKKSTLLKTSVPLIGIDIFHHPENIPLIDFKNKIITLNNVLNNYPTLINGGYLNNWKVKYLGLDDLESKRENEKLPSERVDSYGYTGCLNFLNTEFNMTDIIATNGRCEDSINIINSSGNINNLIIRDAYKDGLDADFSNLKILNSYINRAGNDCIDISSGNYEIKNIITSNCSDKSISVGEKSILNIDNLYSEKSNIAVAVKDSSKVNLKKAKIFSSKFCLSTYKKKQEFGGAFIKVSEIECEGEIFNDKNSLISF